MICVQVNSVQQQTDPWREALSRRAHPLLALITSLPMQTPRLVRNSPLHPLSHRPQHTQEHEHTSGRDSPKLLHRAQLVERFALSKLAHQVCQRAGSDGVWADLRREGGGGRGCERAGLHAGVGVPKNARPPRHAVWRRAPSSAPGKPRGPRSFRWSGWGQAPGARAECHGQRRPVGARAARRAAAPRSPCTDGGWAPGVGRGAAAREGCLRYALAVTRGGPERPHCRPR